MKIIMVIITMILIVSCENNLVELKSVQIEPENDIAIEQELSIDQEQIIRPDAIAEMEEINDTDAILIDNNIKPEIDIEESDQDQDLAYTTFEVQKNASSYRMNFNDADEWCKIQGFDLPTVTELKTILIDSTNCPVDEKNNSSDLFEQGCNSKYADNSKCAYSTKNYNGVCEWYWTKTLVSDKPLYHWVIHFDTLMIGYDDSTDLRYVRCVKRGY